jgi:hypothetical protein
MSSGGSLKHFFEQPAVEDSRVFAQMGRTFGIPALTAEAKHNEQNPGRAITKASEYALASYLGTYLAAGDAASAGAASTDAAESGGTLGLNAAGTSVSPYLASQVGSASGVAAQMAAAATDAAESGGTLALNGAGTAPYQLAGGLPGQAQQFAAAQALQPPANTGLLNSLQNGYGQAKGAIGNAYDAVGNKAASLAYRGMVPGAGTQQADMLAAQTGDFGGYGLGQTMKAAAGAQGLSPYQQIAGQYGGNLLNSVSGVGSSGAGRSMALEMGKNMLTPQRQPMPQGAPMRGGGSEAPLTNPYGQNSLTINSMSDAEKQKLRALGYNIP